MINSEVDIEVFLLEKSQIQKYSLCRGLIILQGTSSQFFHILGSNSQKIAETSQKTKTFSVKLILKEEKLLYQIISKISDQDFDLLQSISKNMMLLVLQYLKLANQDEGLLIKIISR